MDTKKEKLLNKTYNAFIDLTLYDLPIEKSSEIVASDVTGYGSTVDEKVLDIKRLKKIVTDQREQGAGIEMKINLIPVHRRISPDEDTAIYTDECEITMVVDGNKNVILLRISSVFEFSNNTWKLVHLHGSKAVETEEDTWHLNEWQRKNEALQKLVDEQTADLLNKNKELEIEAALERVRARTMAMQKSEELQETALLLFNQVQELGISSFACGFNIWDSNKKAATTWMGSVQGLQPPFKTDSSKDIYLPIYKASIKGKSIFVIEQGGKELEEHYAYLASIPTFKNIIIPNMKKKGISFPPFQIIHCSFFSDGYLMFITYKPVPEAYDIFKRFAKVFEQTYKRFLDLQKAEAQARESQIQLALERVRARTMAMQHSDELSETSFLLAQQVRELGINAWGCAFHIYADNEDGDYEWFSNEEGYLPFYKTPRKKFFKRFYEKRKNGETFYVEEFKGKKCAAHYDFMMSLPVVGDALKELKKSGKSLPESQIDHIAYFKYGYLLFITYEPVTEAYEIFKRFGKVFQQTYTRFLDLQKAEAQAREAQIETALERVRAKTMAMQKSNELAQTAANLFEQMEVLGIKPYRCNIAIVDNENKKLKLWSTTNHGNVIPVSSDIPFNENPVFKEIHKGWKKQKKNHTIKLVGEDRVTWTKYISKYVPFEEYKPKNINKSKLIKEAAFFNNFYFRQGYFLIHTTEEISEEDFNIIQRFANVFEQTYTRFLDLKKAEAQAREAQIQLALERVRARAMAMHNSDELLEVINVISLQLRKLDIKFGVASFGINNDNLGFDFWLAAKGFTKPQKLHVPNINNNNNPIGNRVKEAQQNGLNFFADSCTKEEHREWIQDLIDNNEIDKENKLLFLNLPGFERSSVILESINIYILRYNGIPFSNQENEIFIRFANVFEQAYIRFLDLQKAEAMTKQAEIDLEKLKAAKKKTEKAYNELKATQSQLIQSEKMASLGELTAGIAHEIQNPLNFVNNFSEVSNELIDEMAEEIDKGDFEEVKELATDIKQNLEKINHHGKRASSIVKGMLDHSRTSNGVKVLTDINILADEYLRLAYHGLRAKDKSFNANFKTNFDKTIPQISVVPQDFGRVILNLINNAFYAVRKKAKDAPEDYNPTVMVSTIKKDNNVVLTIRDNGDGIPKDLVNKIFQPFFTTKPSGEGTGLGLSLAYEIVTKGHGGELTINSKKGIYTEFKIILPIQKPKKS